MCAPTSDAPSSCRQAADSSLACNTPWVLRNLRQGFRSMKVGFGLAFNLPATSGCVVLEITLWQTGVDAFRVA